MLARWTRWIEEGLMAFLLAAMTVLTFVQVILRYLFNSGLVWGMEATTYMFGWMVLLGMSYGVKVNSHIGVDILVQQLSPQWRRLVGLLGALFCVAYAAILLYGGWNYVDTMHTLGIEAEDIPIERWLLVSVIPIGFALLLLRLLQVTWRIVTGQQEGFHLADEAKEAVEQFAGIGKTDAEKST